MAREAELSFRYRFTFEDGKVTELEVQLDPVTLGAIGPAPDPAPEWTRLDFHQCPNCPLDPKEQPYCPPALRLVEVVEAFPDVPSFERVAVRVEAKNRTYVRDTDLQTGASALIGLVMTTAGCPVMDRLRPMIDTHLPFMSDEESTYRFLGTYLLVQYFRAKKGKEPDWGLERFGEFFAGIQRVNRSFLERLRAIPMKDASANAVVILDNLGAMAGITIARERCDRLALLFAPATEAE